MSDWKQAVANKAEQALEHELVKSVIDELLMNLGHGHDSLPHYGICKVAHYAATDLHTVGNIAYEALYGEGKSS